MVREYMIDKIVEMLSECDISLVVSVYSVLNKLNVQTNGQETKTIKKLLETIEHLFYHKGARSFVNGRCDGE